SITQNVEIRHALRRLSSEGLGFVMLTSIREAPASCKSSEARLVTGHLRGKAASGPGGLLPSFVSEFLRRDLDIKKGIEALFRSLIGELQDRFVTIPNVRDLNERNSLSQDADRAL